MEGQALANMVGPHAPTPTLGHTLAADGLYGKGLTASDEEYEKERLRKARERAAMARQLAADAADAAAEVSAGSEAVAANSAVGTAGTPAASAGAYASSADDVVDLDEVLASPTRQRVFSASVYRRASLEPPPSPTSTTARPASETFSETDLDLDCNRPDASVIPSANPDVSTRSTNTLEVPAKSARPLTNEFEDW